MFESYKKCNISIKEPFNDYSSSNLVPIDPVFSKNDIELNLKVVFHAKTYVSPYMIFVSLMTYKHANSES
jgi:hypothetical protein